MAGQTSEERDAENAGNESFAPGEDSWWILVTAIVASALLRFLAHPPVQVSLTIWVALIGYFVFFNRVRSWMGLIGGTWVWAMLFYLPGIFWIRHVSVFAWLGLSAISAAFPLVFAVLLRWISPRPGARQVVTAAAAWLISEYVQTHFLSGFPYLFLSHSQAEVTPLIQISEITGAWGVSAIIVLVNGVLYLVMEYVWHMWKEDPSFQVSCSRMGWLGGGVALLLAGSVAFGIWRLDTMEVTRGPQVGVLQGNIPQTIKNQSHTGQEIFDRYRRLARSVSDRAELIVWPETMFPYPVLKAGGRARVSDPAKLKQLMEATSVPHLIGVRTIERRGEQRSDYNSAWLVNRDGDLEQFYAKYHLVPFGEYVPGQSLVPGLRNWMSSILPIPEAMWLDAGPPPSKSRLVAWNGWELAPMICYEVVFPDEFRAQVNKGADVVVNMSNEAWYRNEAELDQMLSIVRFRSVEHRVTTVRATNTGISGFVFPDGRAHLMRDEQGSDRGFRGAMVDRPNVWRGRTFFSTYGNWLIWGGVILLLWLAVRGNMDGSGRIYTVENR
jgi:apolipoprotein N-acyltransferase